MSNSNRTTNLTMIPHTFKVQAGVKRAFEKRCYHESDIPSVILRKLMREYAAGNINFTTEQTSDI